MNPGIDRKEFDELVVATGKAFSECAQAMDVMREAFTKAAAIIGSFERFYCRNCKALFRRGELPEITGLSVPCPNCKHGLVPARNIKLEDQGKQQ